MKKIISLLFIVTTLLVLFTNYAYMAQTSLSAVQGTIYANTPFTPATTVAAGTFGVVPAEPVNPSSAYKVLTNVGSGADWQTVTQLKAALPVTTRAMFRGYNSANQTTTGSVIQVLINTEQFDTTNSFASNVFTCPRAGFYRVTAKGYFTGNYTIGSEQVLVLRKNGITYTTAFVESYTTGTNELPIAINDVIQCNANDTIDLMVSGLASQTFGFNSNYGGLIIEEINTSY
jgi:hypothetical protein